MRSKNSAITELIEFLKENENVEAIVFGPWSGYNHDDKFIPKEKQGVILTLTEAIPFMNNWNFIQDYGSPNVHTVWIWTNLRTIWVHEYDGSSCLASMPRNPIKDIPEASGL